MKLRYEFDLTDAENTKRSGGTDLPGALPILVRDSGVLAGGTDYLYKDNEPQAQLCLAAADDLGMFLRLTADGTEYLSCGDADDLAETVDVRGDDLLVSRGLFIPVRTALSAIRYFAENGQPDPAVKWIKPEDLPEDGNYII